MGIPFRFQDRLGKCLFESKSVLKTRATARPSGGRRRGSRGRCCTRPGAPSRSPAHAETEKKNGPEEEEEEEEEEVGEKTLQRNFWKRGNTHFKFKKKAAREEDVEEDDGVGFAAHGVRELTAVVESHVPGRASDLFHLNFGIESFTGERDSTKGGEKKKTQQKR